MSGLAAALLGLGLGACAGVDRGAPAQGPAAAARAPPTAAVPGVAAGPAGRALRPATAPGSVGAVATLDLASLESRLKDTPAIGIFTKLALKNQVDDLLGQFRAFYQGRLRASLAELRGPFERLLLKVLSLLQDGDPGLAKAIVASREALWRILADAASFAALELAAGDTR